MIGLSKLFPKVVTWVSNNPIKQHRISLYQRHELLNVLVKAIALPNVELRQTLSSKWAIRTLEQAKINWPTEHFTLVIGSDLVQDLPNWLEAEDLMRKATLGIVPREGWPVKSTDLQIIQTMGGQIELLPLVIPASASSNIHKQPMLSQIPKAILPILRQRNLYGISNKM